jgi:hypothetical protein
MTKLGAAMFIAFALLGVERSWAGDSEAGDAYLKCIAEGRQDCKGPLGPGTNTDMYAGKSKKVDLNASPADQKLDSQ